MSQHRPGSGRGARTIERADELQSRSPATVALGSRPPLGPDALGALPADVIRPGYDRRMLQAGIVHLGVGAFQRAHLAVVHEAALEATRDWRWGVIGVSLRRPDTRDALAPQHGLYTVAVRDAEAGRPRERLQVIGHLLEVLVATDSPAAVIDRIADPATRIVSLTITEKGYARDPATGSLDWSDPDIAHDLQQPETARSAIGFLVRGLQRRRARGLGPLTLMSLDNLPDNGGTLRRLVLAFAGRVEPALAQWIETRCSCPSSMVDRIVPRTTDTDRAGIAARLGWHDAWPVVGEPFLEWAVEDHFVAGRPAWEQGGARFVADVAPYERLKLRMVNGTHSALAYLSLLAGWPTVDAALAVPTLRRYLDRLMQHEIAPTLTDLEGVDLTAYRQALLDRYTNPALAHRTAQIAMDGSQKLPQRLLGTVRDRLAAGDDIALLALAVAGWLRCLHERDEADRPIPIDDPLAAMLRAQVVRADGEAGLGLPSAAADAAATEDAEAAEARTGVTATAVAGGDEAAHRQWTRTLCAGLPFFGDLAREARFVEAVGTAVWSLAARGVRGTLQDVA